MSNNTFYVYILVLTVGLMQAYTFFSKHYSGIDELKLQVTHLQKQIESEKLKTQIARYETESLQQHVATLIPDVINAKKTDYQLRSLASVVQAQEPLRLDSSEKLMSSGKSEFAKQHYQEAIGSLKKLIETYPDSVEVVEAYFLLSESYFQIQSFEDSIDAIEAMVTLFPESELTGYALLRLSNIYVERAFPEDARQILYTVRHQFAFNTSLVEQANALLKKLE